MKPLNTVGTSRMQFFLQVQLVLGFQFVDNIFNIKHDHLAAIFKLSAGVITNSASLSRTLRKLQFYQQRFVRGAFCCIEGAQGAHQVKVRFRRRERGEISLLVQGFHY
jgi:hypothetical protein